MTPQFAGFQGALSSYGFVAVCRVLVLVGFFLTFVSTVNRSETHSLSKEPGSSNA